MVIIDRQYVGIKNIDFAAIIYHIALSSYMRIAVVFPRSVQICKDYGSADCERSDRGNGP